MRGRGGNAGVFGAVVVAVVVAAAGCGGQDVATKLGRPPGSGLTGAMGHVADTEGSRQYFEYGNVATLRATGITADPRFSQLNGVGYSPFVNAMLQLPDLTGFDPRKASGAVFVGVPPTVSGVLFGDFDAAQVTTKLGGTGQSRKDGDGTLLVRHPDNRIDLNDPLSKVGVLTALNVVYVADSQIAYGSTEQALRSVRATGSDTLADREPQASLARCLGDDVTVAILVRSGDRTYGVGARVSSKDDVTELWCVAADSSSDARTLAATVQDRLDNDSSPQTREPWRDLLADPRAEAVAGRTNTVRVTARSAKGRPAGIFLDMLRVGDLDNLAR